MKKSSFRAQQTKRTHCCDLLDLSSFQSMHLINATYLVGVVEVHEAVLGGNILVALALAAHDQRRIHVHVMAGKIQADQDLEDHREGGFRGGEEDQQAGGCAAIGDHVQDGAEAGGLLELARSHAIESI
jgi:hypothetical protein